MVPTRRGRGNHGSMSVSVYLIVRATPKSLGFLGSVGAQGEKGAWECVCERLRASIPVKAYVPRT